MKQNHVLFAILKIDGLALYTLSACTTPSQGHFHILKDQKAFPFTLLSLSAAIDMCDGGQCGTTKTPPAMANPSHTSARMAQLTVVVVAVTVSAASKEVAAVITPAIPMHAANMQHLDLKVHPF